jgi:hypothetical protein
LHRTVGPYIGSNADLPSTLAKRPLVSGEQT